MDNQEQIVSEVLVNELQYSEHLQGVRVRKGARRSRIYGTVWKERDGLYFQSFKGLITDGQDLALVGELSVRCVAVPLGSSFKISWTLFTKGLGAFMERKAPVHWSIASESGHSLTPWQLSEESYTCGRTIRRAEGSLELEIPDITAARSFRTRWEYQVWTGLCSDQDESA